MYLDFFLLLKSEGIPVSISEYLELLRGLQLGVARQSVEDFYFLSKSVLVKHEQYLDRFDLLFGRYFKGVSFLDEIDVSQIPRDWLEKEVDRIFTEEEKKRIEAMGGLDALLKRFEELLEQQKEKHTGGNTWIGTGGTSPFGHGGYNPEGIRIGGDSGGHGKALKVWDKREYRNYAGDVELNTRNIKLALKRLRLLTREGIDEELALSETIDRTSRNAGYLDIVMQPSRRNRIKVLIFFDAGGSMDPYVDTCSQLFSAAKAEFKHMEYFYFHNCIYEFLWKDNNLRWDDRTPTFDVIHKFNSDYRVIIIGDAYMAPYEITHAGGSVEHYNDESGATWLTRIRDHFPHIVWINPSQEQFWNGSNSTMIIKELFHGRMYPMTLDGLGKAMKALKGKKVKHSV